MDATIVRNEEEYKQYANFIVENLHKVTSGLKVMKPPGPVRTFGDVLKNDKSEAIQFFWSMLAQGGYALIIFSRNNQTMAFAVMQSTKILMYLFVADAYQKQGYGSKIISYLKEITDFRVKIEEKEYANGLNKFYEKNGFRFIKKTKAAGINYYEYTC